MVRKILGAVLALCAAATPVLAAAAGAPPVEDYGKLPAMSHVTLSPSGTRYAFVTGAGGALRIGVATVDNQPVLSFPVGDSRLIKLEWAGDDHLVLTKSGTYKLDPQYFMRTKDGLITVVAVNLNTKKAISVFIDPSQQKVAQTVLGNYGTAEVNGRWYGFFAGLPYTIDSTGQTLRHQDDGGEARDGEPYYFPDLFRVDLDTGDLTTAAYGEPNTYGWFVGPDGTVVAHTLYDQHYKTWQINTGPRGGVTLMSGEGRYGGPDILGFGKTPSTLIVDVPSVTDDSYIEAPLAGGPGHPAVEGLTNDVMIDPTSKLWVGTVKENDNLDTVMATGGPAKLGAIMQAFDGHRPSLASFSADFGKAIIYTDGDGDSGTYWFVDAVKQSADRLGSAYPSIDSDTVGSVRMVDWKAADGTALRGVLTLPQGHAPKGLPVVVMPHGGPEARDYPGFDWWAQAFAAQGYAVFQPNFRGSDGYGIAFRDAGMGEWGHKMQTDVSDGLAELARQGIVDAKRACIVGGSYGGYVAEAGVTLQQGLYRCAVSVAGVSDLPGFLDYVIQYPAQEGGDTRYWQDFMGAKSFTQSELHAVSPRDLAAQADAPMLLIHDEDDLVVPVTQSQSLAQALKAAGKPVELELLPGGDHGFSTEAHRVAMVKDSVAFVVKHNPPDPAPSAAVASAAAH